jgi:hypothetical protein
MAITKNELSELVRDIKSGGDPSMEGKFHPTIIWKIADMVIGGMIEMAMYKTQGGNGYDINGDFITTFKNVEVRTDADTDEKYSVLPAPVISLKHNRGLHRVSEMKNLEDAFALVPNGSHDVFSILDAHYLNQKTEVYQEGGKIIYRNLRPTVEKVMVKMVAGISALDPDSPIPIPASMEDAFLQRVLELLDEQKLTPQDKVNDNNPNIPQ